MNKRYLAFQALANDPYYGAMLNKLPQIIHAFIVARLEETADLDANQFAVYVRNLFVDAKTRPTTWVLIDEILSVCGQKASRP